MSNYPLPAQQEVGAALAELRQQREARERQKPVYLDHPGCQGTGYVWACEDDCAGTSRGEPWDGVPVGRCCRKVDCPAADCCDGTQLCVECIRAGRTVRVQPYPDCSINIGAVRMDGDEPLCARHYDLLETLAEVTEGRPATQSRPPNRPTPAVATAAGGDGRPLTGVIGTSAGTGAGAGSSEER